jgi:AcrR family transcriptional regulator
LASQRARLLQAMVEVSAELGYPSVTISDIVQRAGVARRTFYEHFESKEACFLAAYDYTAEQILEPLLGAFDPVDDATKRAERYIGAILDALAARPELAQMLVVQIGTGGPAAVAHRLSMHRRIAAAILDLNRQTIARGVDVPALSPERALAIVGALVENMHAAIEDRGAQCLPDLRAELAGIVAALITGPAR